MMEQSLEQTPHPHPLMRTGEVARLFRVDPSTVIRWAQKGKFQCGRTLGGQRRYLRSEIEALAAADGMRMSWPWLDESEEP
jgi:excisionase family DNA binding protein